LFYKDVSFRQNFTGTTIFFGTPFVPHVAKWFAVAEPNDFGKIFMKNDLSTEQSQSFRKGSLGLKK